MFSYVHGATGMIPFPFSILKRFPLVHDAAGMVPFEESLPWTFLYGTSEEKKLGFSFILYL